MPTEAATLSFQVIFAAARKAGDRSMHEGGRIFWRPEDYQACWNELERLCPVGSSDSYGGHSGSALRMA